MKVELDLFDKAVILLHRLVFALSNSQVSSFELLSKFQNKKARVASLG